MEELKEIKSVAIVPFTMMSSSISAVVGLIYALILILVLGVVAVFLPSESHLITSLLMTASVAIIIILPVGSFLLSILSSFLIAFIYNLLVPRIGGIKLGMVEMKEVRSVPVIPLSLMAASIYTILTFLIMLIGCGFTGCSPCINQHKQFYGRIRRFRCYWIDRNCGNGNWNSHTNFCVYFHIHRHHGPGIQLTGP